MKHHRHLPFCILFHSVICLFISALALTACGSKQEKEELKDMPLTASQPTPGDSAIYGLACDGCTDTILVLLPNQGGDPITFNILKASKNHQIFGRPQIGDWVAVMVSKEDSLTADLVVDLEQVKGTWTYQVLPTLRKRADISKKMQKEFLEHMPDSLREILMVPREYGFTLMRHSQASPVGYVRQANSLEDNGPTVYPPVPHYTEWHPFNGKIILVRDTSEKIMDGNKKLARDTASFVFLRNDSLVLRFSDGETISYHRKANARTANAAAAKAAAKQSERTKERLK